MGRGSRWSLPCLAAGSGSRVAHASPALATAPEEGTPRAAVPCPDGCDPGPTPQQQSPALFVGPGSRGHRRPQSWARRRAPGGRACCRAPHVRTGLLHDSCGPGCLGPGAPARSGSEEGRRSPSGEGAGLRLRPPGGDRETTPAPSGRPAPFPPQPRDTGERRRLGYHRALELTRRGSARRPRSTPGGRRDSDFALVLKLCPWTPGRPEERSAPLRSRSPHSTDFQGRGGGAGVGHRSPTESQVLSLGPALYAPDAGGYSASLRGSLGAEACAAVASCGSEASRSPSSTIHREMLGASRSRLSEIRLLSRVRGSGLKRIAPRVVITTRPAASAAASLARSRWVDQAGDARASSGSAL